MTVIVFNARAFVPVDIDILQRMITYSYTTKW